MTASDGVRGDFFGSSVSISGDYVIVGAANHVDGNGSSSRSAYMYKMSVLTTSVKTADLSAKPEAFLLRQNYPNPFNPTTTIQYDLPQQTKVQLAIFNTAGRRVKTLVNGARTAGYHSLTVDMQGLSSGIYFYRLQAGRFSQTQRMLFLK